MNQKEWREYCLANGLCVSCHKPSDTGKQYCSECAEKHRRWNAEQRQFYILKGICPVCRTNNLIGDEKTCAECRAAKALRDKKRNPQRLYINKAERRKMFKAQKRCTICGTLLTDDKYTTCEICREKRRSDYALYKGQDRSHRASKQQCYICGSYDLVDGKNLCKLCYKRIIKNTEKMWDARRKDNTKDE